MSAACALHPDVPATGACARCGTFYCAPHARTLGPQTYCATCAALPDVDYLEAFRLRYWGKRDGYAWLFCLQGLSFAVLAVTTLVEGAYGLGALFLGFAAIFTSYFLGWAPARFAVFAVPVSLVLLAVVGRDRGAVGLLFTQVLFPTLFYVAAFFDRRNQLFFRRPVARGSLQTLWHLYANNRLARAGFMLSLLGLLAPVLSPLALALSYVGLRRVDPHAHPPVGRRGQALAGMVLGGVGCVWGVALLVLLRR